MPVPQTATPSAVPSVVPTDTPPTTAKAPPVVVETDLIRASIDPLGAVVSHVELLGQAVAPDWTASGVIGLVTGRRHEPKATTVLLDVGPNRVYVAQSGVVGGEFPNHRTPFKPLDGSTTLKEGQDHVDVRFSAESGGVRVIKTYTFHRGRYAADVKHEIVNLTDKPLTPSVYFQLTRDGNKPDGESALYYVYTGPAIYTEQEKFRKIEFSEIEKNKVQLPKASDNGWIGMIQHYFVSAWVPPAGALREYYARTVDKNLYSIGSIVAMPALAPNATATSQVDALCRPAGSGGAGEDRAGP